MLRFLGAPKLAATPDDAAAPAAPGMPFCLCVRAGTRRCCMMPPHSGPVIPPGVIPDSLVVLCQRLAGVMAGYQALPCRALQQ